RAALRLAAILTGELVVDADLQSRLPAEDERDVLRDSGRDRSGGNSEAERAQHGTNVHIRRTPAGLFFSMLALPSEGKSLAPAAASFPHIRPISVAAARAARAPCHRRSRLRWRSLCDAQARNSGVDEPDRLRRERANECLFCDTGRAHNPSHPAYALSSPGIRQSSQQQARP